MERRPCTREVHIGHRIRGVTAGHRTGLDGTGYDGCVDHSMADPARRLSSNAEGALFVDALVHRLRRLPPARARDVRRTGRVLGRRGAAAGRGGARRGAARAGGVPGRRDRRRRAPARRAAVAAFPLRIDGPVSLSRLQCARLVWRERYLLEHARGNWMIDAPRWNAALARAHRSARRGALRLSHASRRCRRRARAMRDTSARGASSTRATGRAARRGARGRRRRADRVRRRHGDPDAGTHARPLRAAPSHVLVQRRPPRVGP